MFDGFTDPTAVWFRETFEAPTPVQTRGWSSIAAGNHSLLLAPTGSGKTLAAFLYAIDRLSHEERAPDESEGVRVLYVSPLKALVYDVERNLHVPLIGIERVAARLGAKVVIPRVDVRTGDTSAKARRGQLRQPAEIFVTTPESLYLVLGSQARETLRSVHTVIVDEVHALAPTKRGAHLALSLERLCRITDREPQRIGLSATAQPLAEVARFLGGDREVEVIDTTEPPRLDVQVVVPVADMTRPQVTPIEIPKELEAHAEASASEHGIWPAVYPKLVELIRAHRSTIVFVNSRGLCERLAQQLNETAGEDLVRAHHGSLAHGQRKEIEEALKEGRLAAIVATSSLELGIDMGAVDLVVMVESPGAVSRGLQRIGRAGHQVGEVSIGRIFPKHRGDLLEATVVVKRMTEGAIEPLAVPQNPLDVLAQQIVAMVAVEPMKISEVETLVKKTSSYRDLPRDGLVSVLDMLSGRYPSNDFADLRPRIVWDRESDVLTARAGSKILAAVNAGTIPDRGLYGVHLGPEGPRVGELDEEMVHETIPGQTFMLGASTWRVEEITRDRVIVSPAPGEPGKLPFWHGDGPGRPLELGRAIGEFTRKLVAMDDGEARAWLVDEYKLDPFAANNLIHYVAEQKQTTGTVPTDRAITIERFRDELGDWRICILTPFGARVHAPWALALQNRLSSQAGFDVQAMWSDDGIVMTIADGEEPPALKLLLPEPEELEDAIVHELARSALFAAQFRENAARALLLPRRTPKARTPLWAQRLRSQKLLGVAQNFPSFPIVIETYRACLKDVFDLPALDALLRAINRREIKVDEVETPSASPFSRSLVFAYVAAYLYEGDSPLAERKAQALALDRKLLRELLGQEELRELLDAAVIDEVEEELQRLAPERRARHVDAVHDLLRWVGDLTDEEAAARIDGDAAKMLDDLRRSRRAFRLRVHGRNAWVAAEDVALYRDALGAQPPPGVPGAFLDLQPNALEVLVLRYARTHGPFETTDVVARLGLVRGAADAALANLEAQSKLIRGEFKPGVRTGTIEWCETEVLRQIKRRTLAKLRNEVAPVDRVALARFLPAWHGIGEASIGGNRLEEAIAQLEGLPLSYDELENVILPARVRGFRPEDLDDLGASGWLVWVGHSPLGREDGKIALYRRERVSRYVEPPSVETVPFPLDDRHHAVLAHLERRGASFYAELAAALSKFPDSEVLEALWDLAFAGFVTNDTFRALRSLSNRKAIAKRPRSKTKPGAGGRWSLVSGLLFDAPSPTERAHARALLLLDRHGIVTREVSALENLPGGFGPTYKVLKVMEESGKVRRGYFIDGLGGAQFAYPGAVDRLRGLRQDPETPEVRVISAVDPANPYGWLLPWPDCAGAEGESTRGPKRIAGASVVLVNGRPVLFSDRNGKRLRTFAGNGGDDLLLGARALGEVARRSRGKLLRVEEIDDEPARTSRHLATFKAASFTADHRALLLDASGTS
jgi:ATP-dependent Lhr-like helicase